MAGKTIYISSTYQDLRDFREAAARTIRDFGHTPVDSYSAGPEPVIESCLQDVDKCDALVGIVAWRLGWKPPPDSDTRTISEREFDQAKGKPRLIFLRDDSDKDLDAGIRNFRQKFQKEVRPAVFSAPDDFIAKLREALRRNFGDKPEDTSLHNLPYFCDRVQQYQRIEDLLSTRNQQNSSQLLMLVVHGDLFQGGSRFVDVLESKLQEFPASRELGTPVTFRPAWPDSFANPAEFRTRLAKAVAAEVMKDRNAARADVEQRIKGISAPIVIHTYVPTSDWRKTGEDAVVEFFNFWNEWKEITRIQPILVVLRVEYEEIAQANFLRRWALERTNHAIREFLSKAFGPANALFEVLTELPRVPRKDVVEWSRSDVVCKYVKSAPALEPDINELYGTTFAKEPGDGPRMDPLAKRLIQLLKAQV